MGVSLWLAAIRRVGKANGSRECAPDDRLRVPTFTCRASNGGHAALSPPYDDLAVSWEPVRDCHSGAMRSIEPGISRFRVRALRAPERQRGSMQQMVRRALPDLAVGVEPQIFADLVAALVGVEH